MWPLCCWYSLLPPLLCWRYMYISVSVNLFPTILSCLSSLSACLTLALSVFFCHFFLHSSPPAVIPSRFVFAPLTTAPAEHQSLSVSLVVFWSCQVAASSLTSLLMCVLTTDTNHHWDSLHLSHSYAIQSYPWLLNRLKHAVYHSCWGVALKGTWICLHVLHMSAWVSSACFGLLHSTV